MLNMRSNSDAKGIEIKRPNDPIYSFPCPDCMCRISRLAALRSSPPPWSVWKDKFCIHCFHPIIRIRFPMDQFFCIWNPILSFHTEGESSELSSVKFLGVKHIASTYIFSAWEKWIPLVHAGRERKLGKGSFCCPAEVGRFFDRKFQAPFAASVS